MTIKDASHMEVRVLGDYCQVIVQSVLPDLRIFRFVQADASNMS